jgi:hypothetical protein
MRDQVLQKQAVLATFLAELDAKAARYRDVAAELGLNVDEAPAPAPAPAPAAAG